MFEFRNGSLHAESVPLEAIAREFGTPCYVYSRAALAAALSQFQSACAISTWAGAWVFVTGMKHRRTSAPTCARYSSASVNAS
jgi:diaminopimelate decarboxylase